jgi:hypothetical protein
MPEWLTDMTPTAPEEAGLVDEALTEAELPDWLVPAEAGLEEGELLERAEIPDWLLALKPRELGAEPEEEEAPAAVTEKAVEETGLLAGLQGTLPVEMLIAQPRAAAAKELEVSQAVDTPQARLFAEIVARPPSVTPKSIARPKAHQLSRLPRLIIYFALIAAVAFPLLLGESLLLRAIDPSPAVVDLCDSIEALDSAAPVLVAFDYDPTTAGEMDVVARAIVSHLADQEARLVAVSLLPAGPATAQRLLEETAAAGQYANLGYVPGQAAAVRLLGQSLEAASPLDYQGTPLAGLAAMDGVTSLQDFDLVIELAGTQETLRWWIEQGGQPYGIPMGTGVSASVEPFAQPYYETESRQLVGLVSGVPGAAMYGTHHSGQDRPADMLGIRLDALLAGSMVFVLVLLVGSGVHLVQRKSEEKR